MTASTGKVVGIATKSCNETTPGRGASKLREAADEVLCRDSNALAEALSKAAQNGKIQSTKFIYELSQAGAAGSDDEGDQKSRSMALELANAPQWTGPLPSETEDEPDEDVTD